MTKKELEQWQAVTNSSQYRWVEDHITRLNGRGTLYYNRRRRWMLHEDNSGGESDYRNLRRGIPSYRGGLLSGKGGEKMQQL